MKSLYKNSNKPFALTTLCVLLAACGGESNTFQESTGSAGEPSATPVLCTNEDLSCVDVIFDDTPVVNLNFECGKFHGVTDATGTARCPVDSSVNFYLRNPGSARKINLGSFSIKSVRNPENAELPDTSLVRIGVKELAENTTKAKLTSLDDSASAVATTAINLSRFIQSLRRKSEPYIATAPVNRVYIDNEIKAQLDQLEQDVDAKDFQDDTFAEKLEPWLKAQDRSLLDSAEAKARLEKTILAIGSGIFFSTPTATLDLGSQLGINLDLGISGSNANNQRASVAMYTLTDRSGYNLGYGMQWTGQSTDSQDAYRLFLTSNFAKMQLESHASGIDPYTSRFKNFKFKVGAKSYEAADANQYSGDTFSFVDGKLTRDLAVLGSANVYEFFTGIKVADQTELGSWEQKSPIGGTSFSGSATVFKTGAANTYLDPAVWRTKDSVKAGTYQFPLYATFTLSYDQEYLDECKKQGRTCASSDQLPVAFLENGDIITDGDNPDMLKNAKPACGQGSLAQTRIGTIRAAYLGQDSNQAYINPSIILAGNQFGSLDGVQIGTSALAQPVKINIAGILQASAGLSGSISVSSAGPGQVGSGSLPANWVNGFNTFTYSRVAQKEAEEEAEKNDVVIEKKSPPFTKDQKLDSEQLTGELAVRVSSCYSVKQK